MRFLTGLVTATLLASVAHGADSPQFRGPDRDGIFPETGLLKTWPEGGPPVIWVAEGLGGGYASVTVVGGRVYVPGMYNGDQGRITTLDLDGNVVGTIDYGKETLDKRAPGPRSTVTIEEDRAYVMSGFGVVTCFNPTSGDTLWQVDTLGRFGGKNITWSIAESLLIDRGNVICTPGGKDASVVALDKMTGETVWTSQGLSDLSAYCSPDVIEHGGRRIILTMTAKYVVGLDADSGEVLWKHGHETDYDIHAVTPVYADGMLYYTAGYGSGGGMLELSEDGASVTPKWRDDNLDCQHHGVILIDGYLYGAGHKSNRLLCIELKSGKVMWETRDVKQGVVVYADGMLYVYEGPKRGIVSLVKATPDGFERSGSFTVTQGADNHWAHPTIANGRLYIRHGDVLIAYDITAP